MPTLTDTRFEYLRSQAYTGTISDMMMAWLSDNSAVQVGAVSDQWREFLVSRGMTPPFNIADAWHEYLGALGYEGTTSDREMQFWQNGAPIINV